MNNLKLKELIGCDPDSSCDAFYGARPKWLQGYISFFDARFLFKSVLTARTEVVVEIGTASGFSTGLLCHALDVANKAGLVGPDFKVVSYDICPQFYADKTKKTGDGAREQLPQHLIDHIVFRNPAVAKDANQEFAGKPIELLFIDANHRHPWPALDLLVMLDSLAPGAVVVLHDINLPLLQPDNPQPDAGAKYLFDELDIEKSVPDDGEMPNIGSIRIPRDKQSLRNQLHRIIAAHQWQADPSGDLTPAYLKQLGVKAD